MTASNCKRDSCRLDSHSGEWLNDSIRIDQTPRLLMSFNVKCLMYWKEARSTHTTKHQHENKKGPNRTRTPSPHASYNHASYIYYIYTHISQELIQTKLIQTKLIMKFTQPNDTMDVSLPEKVVIHRCFNLNRLSQHSVPGPYATRVDLVRKRYRGGKLTHHDYQYISGTYIQVGSDHPN